MKNEPSKKRYEAPHCRKCDGTDIDFTYSENNFGHEIDEDNALELACYFIGAAIKQEADTDADPSQLELMGTTLARLATMQRVRRPEDGTAEDAAAETEEVQP